MPFFFSAKRVACLIDEYFSFICFAKKSMHGKYYFMPLMCFFICYAFDLLLVEHCVMYEHFASTVNCDWIKVGVLHPEYIMLLLYNVFNGVLILIAINWISLLHFSCMSLQATVCVLFLTHYVVLAAS